MCTWYEVIKRDGSAVSAVSAGDLAAAFGCTPADIPAQHEPFVADQCLCDLDLDATLDKFGYRYEIGETSFDELLIQL